MSAIISPCGKYRTRLDRQVMHNSGPTYAFFGINPSTADASIDDATVRKWTGFVRQWGGRQFIVGNVFSYRATDVKELDRQNRLHTSLFGPTHWDDIHSIIAEADVLIPCWGNSAKVNRNIRPCIGELLEVIRHCGKPVKCFGRNDSSGDPKHPLFLPYTTELVSWE